jgi:sugar/nucleoside kinase (ribokinase family)
MALREDLDLSLVKQVDQPYRRVTTSIPFQGERAFVTFADPAPIDLNTYWLECMHRCEFRHLHLGAILSFDQLKPLADFARVRGASISMDCQDAPNLRTACLWRDLLAQVDIFMPNAREAMIVSGTDHVEDALRQLMDWTHITVIKDGGNGAWIGSKNDICHVPAIQAGLVVDTTGAGDCFNAGFLYGYVVEKAPLATCATYGNICGGLSVTQVGGSTASPTRDELKTWLNKS